jgi:alkylated DNA repair protein alkB family protein 6
METSDPPPPPLETITLVPSFVSEVDEEELLSAISDAKGWVELSGRRLLNLGGLVTKSGLVPAPIPKWLQPLMTRASERVGGFRGQGESASTAAAAPNHALVNLYRPGEGILPHEDGDAYVPRVAIVSLGSPAVLRFWRRKGRRRRGDGGGADDDEGGVPVPGRDPPDASVLLEPRSLVVFEHEAYSGCYHGIEACVEETIDSSVINGDRAPAVVARSGDRVSLTIRRVARVRSSLLQLSAKA